jgi:hypothetical protein
MLPAGSLVQIQIFKVGLPPQKLFNYEENPHNGCIGRFPGA